MFLGPRLVSYVLDHPPHVGWASTGIHIQSFRDVAIDDTPLHAEAPVHFGVGSAAGPSRAVQDLGARQHLPLTTIGELDQGSPPVSSAVTKGGSGSPAARLRREPHAPGSGAAGATLFQHQPPSHAGWTKANVATNNLRSLSKILVREANLAPA